MPCTEGRNSVNLGIYLLSVRLGDNFLRAQFEDFWCLNQLCISYGYVDIKIAEMLDYFMVVGTGCVTPIGLNRSR